MPRAKKAVLRLEQSARVHKMNLVRSLYWAGILCELKDDRRNALRLLHDSYECACRMQLPLDEARALGYR